MKALIPEQSSIAICVCLAITVSVNPVWCASIFQLPDHQPDRISFWVRCAKHSPLYLSSIFLPEIHLIIGLPMILTTINGFAGSVLCLFSQNCSGVARRLVRILVGHRSAGCIWHCYGSSLDENEVFIFVFVNCGVIDNSCRLVVLWSARHIMFSPCFCYWPWVRSYF